MASFRKFGQATESSSSKFVRECSRRESPSSTQVTIEHKDSESTLPKGYNKARKDEKGDQTRITPERRGRHATRRRSSSEESISSNTSTESEGNRRSSHKKSSSETRYDKTHSSRKSYRQDDHEKGEHSHQRQRSPHLRKTPEKIPYFVDARREEERLRRKYEHRERRLSSTRSRRRSRTRSHSRNRGHSRDRRRSRHRSDSRERRRSSSRHRSRRRSPVDRRNPMIASGAPPYIPVVYPFPPHFLPAPFAPRFPADGVMRPPYPPPPIVYVVPHPFMRPMHGWMNRPPRPRRNQ